jgi:glycine/sarcosine N-methyltransferase
VRRTTYWALAQRQLNHLVTEAGFIEAEWHMPDSSGFSQPVLTARAP